MLPEKLRQKIKNTQKKKLGDGTLLPYGELQKNYRTFQARFGIERLQSIDGEELLNTIVVTPKSWTQKCLRLF